MKWAVEEIDDLVNVIEEHVGRSMSWPIARDVLCWIDDQGLMRPDGRDSADRVRIRVGVNMDQPVVDQPVGMGQPDPTVIADPGPQADPAPPAGDLNTVAGGAVDCPSPEGADGEAAPSDAPAPPAAGGGVTEGLMPWDDAQDEELRRLKGLGLPIAEIGKRMGRSEKAITMRWYKLRTARAPRPAPSPLPPPTVADQPAVVTVIDPAPVPAVAPWLRSGMQRLDELNLAEDATLLDIAERLTRGDGAAEVGESYSLKPPEVRVLWLSMLTAVGLEEGARPSLAQQGRLLELLRHRVKVRADA